MNFKQNWEQFPIEKKRETLALLSGMVILGILLIEVIYFRTFIEKYWFHQVICLILISIIIGQINKPKKVKN